MKKPIIGIIGGMGPEASSYYYQYLIRQTPVHKDQDHFHVVIDSRSIIPDRTGAILGQSPSPLPALLESVELLNQAQVAIGFMTCFTAHHYYEQLQKNALFTFWHPLEILRNNHESFQKHPQKIGLLATSGTIQTNMFQGFFEQDQILVPDQQIQEKNVMEAIYGIKGIKAGYLDEDNRRLLKDAAEYLMDKGAQVILGGCTEIGMFMRRTDMKIPYVDPMSYLIEHLIEIYMDR